MTQIHRTATSPIARLQQFFHAEESPYGLALVRIFLPFAAMIPMVQRFFVVRELFSTDGTSQSLFEFYGWDNPLPVMVPQLAAACYGLMIFAMACAIVGWQTRLSFCVGVPLYIYFNLLDTVGTMTKYSVIASHLLVLLALSRSGTVWSVDALLRQRRQGKAVTAVPPRVPVWPVRLMQVLFCFVYFGAAITKIQTEAFFSGEQMRYWMLSNWNYENPVGESMAMWTPLLLVSAYITIVWEMVFGFLVWRPGTRLIVLAIGAAFHFMTWLALGLYIFPAICISGYLSFVNEHDVVRLRRVAHRLHLPTRWPGLPFRGIAQLLTRRPASLPLAATWIAAGLLTAVAAAEFEYRLDVYGLRTGNGPLPLRPMEQEAAIAMISDNTPLREKDKYFSFDIGTQLVGGQLADRRREYDYGDVIIAQCNLNPPHEDLWVEVLLQDDQQRTIEQSGLIVTRDQLYANFAYQTGNALLPGRYSMLLRSSGKDISRRTFTLRGDPASLPEMGELLTN